MAWAEVIEYRSKNKSGPPRLLSLIFLSLFAFFFSFVFYYISTIYATDLGLGFWGLVFFFL